LPLLQGVQNGMPLQRRYGEDQDRIFGALLRPARCTATRATDGAHPHLVEAVRPGRAARQPDDEHAAGETRDVDDRHPARAQTAILPATHFHASLESLASTKPGAECDTRQG